LKGDIGNGHDGGTHKNYKKLANISYCCCVRCVLFDGHTIPSAIGVSQRLDHACGTRYLLRYDSVTVSESSNGCSRHTCSGTTAHCDIVVKKSSYLLADLISPYSQSRLLRSSTQKLLSVPPHNLDTAARRFSVAASRFWNSLPLNCRTAPSVNTFKIRLKTSFLIRHNRTVARASVLWRDIN